MARCRWDSARRTAAHHKYRSQRTCDCSTLHLTVRPESTWPLNCPSAGRTSFRGTEPRRLIKHARAFGVWVHHTGMTRTIRPAESRRNRLRGPVARTPDERAGCSSARQIGAGGMTTPCLDCRRRDDAGTRYRCGPGERRAGGRKRRTSEWGLSPFRSAVQTQGRGCSGRGPGSSRRREEGETITRLSPVRPPARTRPPVQAPVPPPSTRQALRESASRRPCATRGRPGGPPGAR